MMMMKKIKQSFKKNSKRDKEVATHHSAASQSHQQGFASSQDGIETDGLDPILGATAHAVGHPNSTGSPSSSSSHSSGQSTFSACNGSSETRSTAGSQPPTWHRPVFPECRKQRNHDGFYSVNSLCVDYMPQGFRKQEWVDLIKLKSAETVRIKVGYTSWGRPDDLGLGELKGMCTPRFGSGTAFLLNMGEHEPCCEANCMERKGPHGVSGLFKVMTVAHCVFDDEEAKNTTIEFFYDDEDRSKVVKAKGVRVSHVDIDMNRSVIECRTHDLDLYKRLSSYREQRIRLTEKLRGDINGESMVVVISHPHNMFKHISIGELIEMKTDKEVKMMDGKVQLVSCTMSYTTPTCVGAGGGSVNLMGKGKVCYAFAPHCSSRGASENLSGLGWTIHNEQ